MKIYLLLKYYKQDKSITFAQNLFANLKFVNRIAMKCRNQLSCFIQFSLIILFLFGVQNIYAQSPKFTLVIDAGHGGHDPGAIGSRSREKDINLDISLLFGELVEKNFNDVKVVYTRKTDKYLTLQERADVVNNNHADLFVCIHTNSAESSSAYGAETFTLGLAKSKSNLDVAMRENSVILLEDNYKAKYKGFDPSSIDSYIMFEFMQDKYIDKSIDLASTIQKQFVKYARRSDRGVRQAGFWVLHRSACPSVLVEVGFISNPSEEKFLSSKSGQNDMATSIYNAFVDFKRNHDKKSGKYNTSQKYVEIERSSKEKAVDDEKEEKVDTVKNEEAKTKTDDSSLISDAFNNSSARKELKTEVLNAAPIFKVQLIASSVKLKANSSELKGLKDLEYFEENGLHKYTMGAETDYKKIVAIRKKVLSKFPDAFIIAFVGDKKITAKEALKLIK